MRRQFLIVYFICLFLLIKTLVIENPTQKRLLIDRWEFHKVQYNLSFNTAEDYIRFKIFQINIAFIKRFNSINSNQFTLSQNQFTHMTLNEFQRYLTLRYSESNNHISTLNKTFTNTNYTDIDWRTLNKVTPVRNQLNCGSCWAFSAIGAIESQIAIHKKEQIILSPQELIDCSTNMDNNGCSGGLMSYSFEYVQRFGLTSEASYPYQGMDRKCRRIYEDVRTTVLKVKNVNEADENELANTVYHLGPVSVGIHVVGSAFMFYKNGIYHSNTCNSKYLNHAVLVVGIGSEPDPYYIIKNSWGTKWGIDGYMYFARNNKNMCGIASFASIPILN